MKVAIDNFDVNDYDPTGLKGERAVQKLLTVREICELLKVPKTYIYWLTHQQKILHIKMQGHLRFRQSDIDEWLRTQEVRNVGKET